VYGKREARLADRGHFLDENYVTEIGISWVNQERASYIANEASWRCQYRGVLEANVTPNITHFTRAMPMLDTPDVYMDGASIKGIKTQNKHIYDVALYKLWNTQK